MPENQTAGTFENQGLKETVNQNNQTGRRGDRVCGKVAAGGLGG